MIRLQDLTPAVYYTQSRDFQFIGRLYDIVLNSVKTNAANLYDLPNGKNMDEKLLNLLATTLGFQSKHRYNTKHLEAICGVLSYILKNKGSLNAVIIAANALLESEGIAESLSYSIDPKKSITLHLPQQLSDLSLLKDLLAYILPAGMSCNMVKEIKRAITANTSVGIRTSAKVYADNSGITIDPKSLGTMLKLKPVGQDEHTADMEKLLSGKPEANSGILVNMQMPENDNE